MAEAVNLDALIPREDFLAPEEGAASYGESGKASASATDLRKGESFFSTLRKPDFQRETAAWSPEQIRDFVKAFIENDLIPSVICWQSPARLSFVIDGAHRLSAIIAWLLDDYGDGQISKEFYGYSIPEEQQKVALRTRFLINAEVGSYQQFREETDKPGAQPEIAARVRGLAHGKIPLLWVTGNDWKKAERAFFTINQSAVQINPTELKILNARSQPNAIGARAIVRNARGHKYWEKFSATGQAEVETSGKAIYRALYTPPIDPPIRTEELPIAGPGYGSQTLPLIFDLVNVANGILVVDASKSRKLKAISHDAPDESKTLELLRTTERLVRRITGNHPSSLGLHPAVYFYAANGRHQPTSVLAIASLLTEVDEKNEFMRFTRNRMAFEEFLVGHKMFINQLTVRHGSMAKGFLPLRDYYRFVLDAVAEGKTETQIEADLSQHERYQDLVKVRPLLTKQAKEFSAAAKTVKLFQDVLASAFRCSQCGARIDKKSMQLDHSVEKRNGGLATTQNSQWLHPYCNSTFKDGVARGTQLEVPLEGAGGAAA
jgi:hypothetical protein